MKRISHLAAILVLLLPAMLHAAESMSVNEMVRKLAPRSGTRSLAGARPADNMPELVLRLQFDLNSDQLRRESMPLLGNLAEALQREQLRDFVFILEGHTCDRGDARYNDRLSLRRVRSVERYLVGEGLNPFQFEMVGYGESRPAEPNIDEAARSRNRRVAIKNTGRRAQRPAASGRDLTIQVKKQSGTVETSLRPGEAMTDADNYVVEFKTGAPLYVYVFQVDSAGVSTRLFPNPDFSGSGNPVRAGHFHRIPGDGRWLHLGGRRGQERIVAVYGSEPVDDPEGLYRAHGDDPRPNAQDSSGMVADARSRSLKGARAGADSDRGVGGIREDPTNATTIAHEAPASRPSAEVRFWELRFQYR